MAAVYCASGANTATAGAHPACQARGYNSHIERRLRAPSVLVVGSEQRAGVDILGRLPCQAWPAGFVQPSRRRQRCRQVPQWGAKFGCKVMNSKLGSKAIQCACLQGTVGSGQRAGLGQPHRGYASCGMQWRTLFDGHRQALRVLKAALGRIVKSVWWASAVKSRAQGARAVVPAAQRAARVALGRQCWPRWLAKTSLTVQMVWADPPKTNP